MSSGKNPLKPSVSRGTIPELVEHADHSLKVRPWRRNVTPWSDIVDHEYQGDGTDESPYIVTWIPTDRENPLTFGNKYKWAVTMLGACAKADGEPRALGPSPAGLPLPPTFRWTRLFRQLAADSPGRSVPAP